MQTMRKQYLRALNCKLEKIWEMTEIVYLTFTQEGIVVAQLKLTSLWGLNTFRMTKPRKINKNT